MSEKEKPLNAEEIRKLHEKVWEEIMKTIEKLRTDGFQINISEESPETPETMTINFIDKNGKKRTMGFMKMPGIEKVIEERIRNSNDYDKF